jgi:perosamine synthetase
MIPVYKPYLPRKTLRFAKEALDSSWVSSQGKFLELTTEKLKELLNVKFVQLTNSGTSATHLVSKVLNFKYPNINKIFVPNNVYVAAWNSFLYDNKFNLIPVDADLSSWNMDLEELESKILSAKDFHDGFYNETAVLLVHNFGNIINPKNIKGLTIIEDNCEGFLGKYNDKFSGTDCLASSISFFGNKNITSGEGGALITNDEESFLYANKIQGQGQTKEKYIHDELGHNYRMTNVQAAILYGQLECLEEIQEKKNNIFNFYRKELLKNERVRMQTQEEDTVPSNWMMAIRITGINNFSEIYEFMKEKGVDIRPMFYPMSTHKYLKKYSNPKEEVIAEILSKEGFILPSYPSLTKKDQKYIVKCINEFTNER